MHTPMRELIPGQIRKPTRESIRMGQSLIPLLWILLTGSSAALAASESEPANEPELTEQVIAPAAEDSAVADDAFAAEQLEQLVAPIALYPDALLSQILMASTYPLEVVEADRFMKKNPELKGDALNAALKEHDWDASVKSLCTVPDVLGQMSENLDWTQDMGDALLGQKTELMDTVQRMRGKAYEAGNLETSEQQVVTQQEDKIIVIESTDPEVVYVPTYSSTVVYGGWGYPHYYYPPFYYPPPPGYGFVSFGVGVIVGGAIWGNCNWGWGGSDIDIDIDRNFDFNRETNVDFDRDRNRDRAQNTGRDGKTSWQHDASHRKGVNYRSEEVAQRNGATAGNNRVTRDQARGRTAGTMDNRMAGSSRDRSASSVGQRPGQNDRRTGDGSAANRSIADRGPSDRAQIDRNTAGRANDAGQRTRNSAYSGSRSPSIDRRSSSRGAMSRGTRSFGGMRGGGRGRR